MKLQFNILNLILAWVISFGIAAAQYTDQVCSGTTRVYRTTGVQGSTFTWEVEGGTIATNWSDSIEVKWGDEPGIFNIQVTQKTKHGCLGAPVYGSVRVSKPDLNLGNNLYICEGQAVSINAGNNFVSYKWNDGSETPVITVNKGGWYTVFATDDNNCTITDSVYVNAAPTPFVELGPDTSLCWTETVELDAGADGTSYKWSTNDVGRYFTAFAGLNYVWVKVTNEYGCIGSDTILIKPCDYSKFADMIPNTFTPNGDGDNDTWWIPWMERVQNVKVEIFDRWGQSVFLSRNGLPATGWNGTRNGKKLPMDSYYYIIDFRDGSKPITGTVTIVR